MKYIRKQTPARILALGFLAVILLGSFLLMPVSYTHLTLPTKA